ncbi:MAG: T9SS type A sorting domain-containing protein [Bacteroidota bacterium]
MKKINYFLTAGLICLTFINAAAQGTWTPLTSIAPAGSGAGMMLLSDGTVLAKRGSGGSDGRGNQYDRLTPDIHGSYINGTWSTTAPMNNTRLYYSSQVLMDGRVYVAGGEYGTGGSSGEVYNPLTNVWTNAPSPGAFLSDANSEILPDGRVLQAVVSGTLRSTLIYNPVTNTYSAGPSCIGIHNESSWVKLADNSILFVDRNATSSERYIPSSNTWINDATVPVALYDPFGLETGAALLLPDGRAFFIGSTGNTAYYTPSGNNSPGTWAAGPVVPGGQGAPDAAAAMMVNGKILCAVSPSPTSGNHFPAPTAFYEFNYLNSTFTQINAPAGGLTANHSCYLTSMLDLPDGTVLYGSIGSSQYYIYTPNGTPLASGKPAIGNITQTSCTQYRITGTLFNGISEGAAYGDDWQMATNYPIIRLTSGTNVYYARTFNWNSTGVRRGNAADTTSFTLPVGIPAGTYSLVVTANGISSNPVSFTTPTPVSFTGLAANYQTGNAPVTLTGVPAGGVFSGPGISGNVFSPATAGAGGPYTITYTVCASSTTHQTTVGGCALPTIPASISVTGGSAKVCPGDVRTYSTPLVAGVTYQWSVPAGAAINNGQGTRTISVTYNNNFVANGVISVMKVNACGNSPAKTLAVNRNVAGTPSAITGSTYGLCSGLNKIYSITPVAGVTYQWTVPAGATIVNGQGTNSITVNFPATAFTGAVSVKAVNACGAGAARNLTVRSVPATAVSITGPITACANQQNVAYSTAAIATATSYNWTVPTGSVITSGQGSNSIVMRYGTVGGNVRVRAANTCGNGSYKTLAVTITCRVGIENDVTDMDVTVYPNPSSGAFHVMLNDNINDYRLILNNLLGEEILRSGNLKAGQSFEFGNDLSAGIYILTVIQNEERKVIRLVKNN